MTQSATAPPSGQFLRSPVWLAAILISLTVAGAHFYFLAHAGGFWRDEVNLINVAENHSLPEMTRDSFPLLMPLLVKIWFALGLAQSDGSLRLLGLFIGLGIVASLWIAAWTAPRRGPPLASLVLFAFNSTAITYSDCIRAYGLGCLMILWLFIAAWFFLKRPCWNRAVLLAVFAVLSVQSLYHNAVLVAAICLGAAAVCARRQNFSAAMPALAAGFVAAISLLPYVPNFVAGRGDEAVLRTGLSWPRFFFGLEEALGFPWVQFVFVWALLVLVAVVLAVLALCKKDSPEKPGETISDYDTRLFAGTVVFIAVSGFLGFLWLTALPGQTWYFLPLMVLVAACLDATLATLTVAARKILFVGALSVFVISLPVAKRDLDYRFTNIDTWAIALTGEAKPDDFAVVTPWFCGLTFAHYFKGATPWTTLPPLADHASHRYDLVRAQMQTTNAVRPVLEKISATLRDGHRVWFLCPAGVVKTAAPVAPPDLPPPPLPDSGWSDEPYEVAWTMQTIYFLKQHAKSFRQVDNPGGTRHIGENLGLFVIEGWNDAAKTDPVK